MHAQTPPSRALIRVQALSGLVLLVFVSLHLFNLLCANFGPDVYDRIQRQIRVVYQFPLFEIVALFGALVVHVGAGLLRVRERYRREGREEQNRRRHLNWGLRLHRWSAYILVLVVFGHSAATRLPSLLFDVWPESGGVAFSLWWMPWLFYPYYFFLAACGLYHGLYGLGMATGALGQRWIPTPTPRMVRWVSLAGMVVILGGLLALGGISYDIPDPTDNEYARIYAKYLGVDLVPE